MLRYRKLFGVLLVVAAFSLAALIDVTYRSNVFVPVGDESMNIGSFVGRFNRNETYQINSSLPIIRRKASINRFTQSIDSHDSHNQSISQSGENHPEVNLTMDGATWVFVLSYQRTGSSFIGGIFNDSERTFYVYEPLDPLYSAMYGLLDGWTVPSDIFSYKNGSLRDIPEDELRAIYWTMEKIYTCQIASLPLGILAHKFWRVFNRQMTHTSAYTKCLIRHKVPATAHERCQTSIKQRCGTRFATKPFNQNKCKHFLWGSNITTDNYVPRCNKHRHNVTDTTLPQDIKGYYQCLIKIEPALTKCAAEYLDKPCKEKSLRVIKTVRANMQAGEYFLKQYPDTYLVHLYRDPRGAVRSRLKATWSQGLWGARSAAKEAGLYCSQVLGDVTHRYQLEHEGYGDRIKELIYDGYVQEPLLNLLDIYHFIGHEPTMLIKNKYISNRMLSPDKNSESIANRWAKSLTKQQQKTIESTCGKFFNETTYKWS